MTSKSRVTWLRLCGLLAVAAIVFVSLMPSAQWAQLRTGNWLIEHVLGYFAASLIICLGWRRPFVVAGGLMAAAVLLEAVQGLIPNRSPNLLSVLGGVGGVLAGVLLAEFTIRIWNWSRRQGEWTGRMYFKTGLVAASVSAFVSALVTSSVLYFGGASTEQIKGEQDMNQQPLQKQAAPDEQPSKIPLDQQALGERDAIARQQFLQKAMPDEQALGGRGADGIELDELIQLYMLPAGSAALVGDWTTSDTAPITWEHSGTQDCETYQKNKFDASSCRMGSVMVSVGKRPTHTVVGKAAGPGRWKISLIGTNAGLSYVAIDCNCLLRSLNAPLDMPGQAGGLKAIPLKSCSLSDSGSKLFRVAATGKKPAFLLETKSCSTSGFCSKWFVLSYGEKYARKLMAKQCTRYNED